MCQNFLPFKGWIIFHCRASLVVQTVKYLPVMQDTQVWSLGWEETLEKGMVTHSSILAWKIPWTEEPGTLQSMGSQRVRHTWATEQQYSIVLVHHILPIYSSIHGHLGGFHVLAVVSNALVSMLAGHHWHWGLYCLSQSLEQSCTLPVVTHGGPYYSYPAL